MSPAIWSSSEAVSCCGGTWVGPAVSFQGVSADTRESLEKRLFIALQGKRFDGHDFCGEALRKGAVALMVNRPLPVQAPQWIQKDTRSGLSRLAAAHRRRFSGQVVGITGSNGKTTCKEMAAAVLAQAGTTLATPGNRNNEIGLPLSLLAADREAFLILEMGANHPGEIQQLSQIARPHAALITSIGQAHLAGFGSLAGVARAKGEIAQGLMPGGVLILPDDLPSVFQPPAGDFRVLTCGTKASAAVQCLETPVSRWDDQGFRTEFFVRAQAFGLPPTRFSLPLAGEHNVRNALLVIALALQFGLDGAQIQAGFSRLQPVPGRLFPRRGKGGWRILDDAYNANPDSVRAAFQVLNSLPGRPVVVLGDLAELGAEAPTLHFQLGAAARAAGIAALYTVGELSEAAARGFGTGQHFRDQTALIAALQKALRPEDTVLIKGSRSAGLESVVEALGLSGA